MNDKINVFEMENNRLLNTRQAAEYLGFKIGYMYNLVFNGVLKPYKCGKKAKGSLRFLKSDLDKFLGRA
jgi:excisionase family DNA binding protein